MAIIRRGETVPAVGRSLQLDPFRTMRELLGWDPFQQVVPELWRGQERLGAFVPAFDVRETQDAFLFKADVPGFREEDIDISVTGNRLSLSGKREAEQVDESETYYCSERSYGTFTRTFTLPEGINADQIRAELKDGVLTVSVPKTAEAQPKRISVRGTATGGKVKA
ncbi:MAG: Hsp20/alpha crystallin family protein [Myxococcaceae bacterium]|nr:Hsp20/alpha crystallin family protein [Myxococcaceae bacterium]